ncbi:MAG TPA: hypothetical protein GXX36_06720 [Clostridiaceae bacterium]|nr:hypothetical protein [Clostridiaceae bacterium]
MKTKFLIVSTCILIIALLVFIVRNTRMKNYIDTSFATDVTLKYYYIDKKIDVVVTDEKDIRVIKENLKGVSYSDNPSCGFSLDISIKLSDKEKSIIICPARDGCSKARIGDSGKYMDIKDRKAFEAVLEKYGMTFPCV